MPYHVVMFSGGKDSTAMLLLMIEKGMPIDCILTVDTTKEFPQMYEHIEQVKSLVAPLNVTTLTIDFDYWFSEHIKTKGKNKGKRGYGWCTEATRWCTALKRDSCKAFLKQFDDVIEYHGIAFDEQHRLSKNEGRNIQYPLVDWQMTEEHALAYCYERELTWGGLYEKLHRVSCFCCPLKRMAEYAAIMNNYPESWEAIRKMDQKQERKFIGRLSFSELEIRLKQKAAK